MELMLALFSFFSFLLIALALPMISGKVKPNHWYGFRVRLTMEDPSIWYAANTCAGKLLLIYGLLLLAAAWLLPLIADITDDGYAILWSVLAMAGIIIVFLLSPRYVNQIANE